MSSSTRIANRFQQTGPSSAEIWAKLRAFAGQPGIINLGQGFPDFDCDEKLRILVSKYLNNERFFNLLMR